ncbi:MIF-like protein mif-2 isoform X1 [Mytilus galloprovincialis]|uniref:MIF-like protein mif-2 isoform X1 n=1 Tax=Mytilus galloprovincialis TaxID=29158 RepID=UPI003F7BEBFF
MPNLYIHTNLKNDDIALDFEEKLIKKVASVMIVPTEVVYIKLTCGDRMYHNGSRGPMMFLDMNTVGKFNETNNPEYTKQFMEFLTENTNIPKNRIVIHYHDASAHEYGFWRRAPDYKYSQYYSP